MATLRTIRKRITSVKNTRQITKAMYMVSAAKLRRAQENAENGRPYSQALKSTIADLVSRVEDKDHPLLQPRDQIKNVELLLITSDRGLCGGYNANLIRMAENFIKENTGKYEKIEVSVLGRKAQDYYKRRRRPVRKATTNLLRTVGFSLASQIADELTERYVSGEVDAVFVVYSTFKSALNQKPTIVQLLPFQLEETDDKKAATMVDYIYEPSAKEILAVLLSRQVRTQIYSAMLEAVASELGARMTAMDSATSNASDMIDRLTLQFNRARQAAITKELMEIIGGAEALKG
ncbi:MAG TPA: ATP synthase F1 subunit gamma [bacterium]|nr:ATP synthase F1 subunit gamma [bacterium]